MIALIAAMSKNRVIGHNGKIPWNIIGEKSRFKDLTTGKIVIMGRVTFEEISLPLPNRHNIVISSSANFDDIGCITANSLDDALKKAENIDSTLDVFIAGGESLYLKGMSIADRIYLTEIDFKVQGDRFFPQIPQNFELIQAESVHGFPPYRFLTYNRK